MRVDYSKKFIKQFDKAPKKIRDQVTNRIELFSKHPTDPILHNHSLVGKFLGFKSINITGDWRAIYKEAGNQDIQVCIFEFLGTHSLLYK